jgi:hypothetical protein
MDAFTSGAIPTHLLTVEAMEEFLRVLKPDGLIVYHISNRHVRLWPVLHGIAERLGLMIRFHEARPIPSEFKTVTSWVVLTRSSDKIAILTAADSRWRIKDDRKVFWTDEFSNLWSQVNLRY